MFMVRIGQKMLGIVAMGAGGNGRAVRLTAELVVSWRILGCPLLVAIGFGPELLL